MSSMVSALGVVTAVGAGPSSASTAGASSLQQSSPATGAVSTRTVGLAGPTYAIASLSSNASVWTDQAVYPPESLVTIFGAGFISDAPINVTVTLPDNSSTSWSVLSDSTGSFVTTYQLDSGFGVYIVVATDGVNNATTSFFDPPNVSPAPTSGPAGTVVTITGSSYTHSAPYSDCLSTSSSTISCVSGSTGAFTSDSSGKIPAGTTITVPLATPVGSYFTITYHGSTLDASAAFAVTPTVTVVCSPNPDMKTVSTVCTATTSPSQGSTGTFTFTGFDTSPASHGTLSPGTGVCSLSGGSCSVTYTPGALASTSQSITATYSGGGSGSTTLNVFSGSVSCSPNPVDRGIATTCTATTTPSQSGTVAFSGFDTVYGVLISATCTLSGGSCSVTYTPGVSATTPQSVSAAYSSFTLGTTSLALNAALAAGAITPSPVSIDNGQSVTLTSHPSGGTGSYTYSWYTGAACTSPIAGTLSTVTVSPGSTTTYYYKVVDSQTSSACSPGDIVTVNPALSAGAIYPQPASIDSGQSIILHANVTTGTPAYHYQWYAKAACGNPVIGTDSATITVSPGSTTTYSYKVTDTSGGTPAQSSCSPNGVVTVNPALSAGAITPASPRILVGGSVMLTANPIGGTTPYTYRWYTGAACTGPIGGATSHTYTASPGSTTTYYYRVNDSSSAGSQSACSAGDTVTVVVTQPLTLTVAEAGAPAATFTLTGCSVSPTTVLGDGNSHNVTATPGCLVTVTVPADLANSRYRLGGGATSTTLTTCLSGTCSGFSATYYYQLFKGYRATPSSPGTWDASFTIQVNGTLNGNANRLICDINTVSGQGSTSCTGWSDYNLPATVTSPIVLSSTEKWVATSTNTFTDTTGGSGGGGTHTVFYSAQFRVSFGVSPPGAGSTTPSASGYYTYGTSLPINATANAGFVFSSWTSSTGLITFVNSALASTSATIDGSGTITANFLVVIVVDTSPSGLAGSIVVDGTTYASPHTFNWLAGSGHTIAANSPVSGGVGTRYVWTSWSDAGAASHAVTSPAVPTTYTANYETQYLLTIRTSGLLSALYPTQVYLGGSPVGSAYDGSNYTQWFTSGASTGTIGVDSIIAGPAGTRFVFELWTDPTTDNPMATVNMTSPTTFTADYLTQYYLTVISAHGSPTGQGWYNASSLAGFGVTTPTSGGPGVQFVFNGWSSSDFGGYTGLNNPGSVNMSNPINETASWVTQYNVTYAQTGCVLSVALPASEWVNDSAPETGTFPSLVSGPGTRCLLLGDDRPAVITGPTTITASYQTQYYLTLLSAHDTPTGQGWYNASSTASFNMTDTVVSGGPGVQYVFAGWSSGDAGGYTGASASQTVFMNNPINETASWTTQFYIVVQSPHDSPTASQWVSQGDSFNASVTSPADDNGFGTRFRATGYTLDGSAPVTDGSSSYNFTNVQASHNITFNWIAQFLVTFDSSPNVRGDGSGTIVTVGGSDKSGAQLPFTTAWLDNGTSLSYSYHSPVSSVGSPSGIQYRWDSTSGLGQTLQSNAFNVTSPGVVNGTYADQFDLVFGQSGLDGSALGTVVSVYVGASPVVNLVYGDLPYDFGFIDTGTVINYTYATIVPSSNSGERFALTTPAPSPASTFLLLSAEDVVGTYKTQYDLQFAQSGLDGSALGTVVSVTVGANPPVNLVYADLPYDFGYVDSGTSVTYSFSSPVSSSSVGVQFVLTTPAPSPVSGFSLSGFTTVTGTYKTQYDLQFAQSGLDGTALGTVVSVTIGAGPAVNLVYADFPYDFGFVDAGTNVNYTFTSPVPSSTAGERFVLTTPAPSPASGFSLASATTVTGTYEIQYDLVFDQSGLDASALGTVVSVTIGANPPANLVFADFPYDFGYVDSGTNVTYAYTSPVASSTSGKQFALTTPAPSPASGFLLSAYTTVTGAYKTQYDLQFAQSGLDGTALGTVVTVTVGASPPVAFSFAGLSHDFGFVDAGTVITYAFATPVSSSTSGKQFVLTTPSPSPASGFGLGGATTVVGTYKTQYKVQFTASANVLADGSGTVVIVGASSVGAGSLPYSTAWLDAGSWLYYSYQSPVASVASASNTRYMWNSTSGLGQTLLTNNFTISGPGTITGTYTIQYLVSFAVSPAGAGTTSPSSSTWYNSGASGIPLSESPNFGYTFASWIVTCSSGSGCLTVAGPTSASTTFSVSGAGTITAGYTTNTVIVNTGSTSGEYSDPAALKATLKDAFGNPLVGYSVKFTIGSQSVTVATGAGGVASASLVLNQPKGTYSLVISFAGDSVYTATSTTVTFTIVTEPATVVYTGTTSILTTSPTSITLSAQVTSELDDAPGHIAYAKVTFMVYLVGNSLTLVYTSSPMNVTQISPGVGTVSLTITCAAIGNSGCATENTYLVYAVLNPAVNNYYSAPDAYNTLVIYTPNGQFATLGGWIVDPNTGNHANFGGVVRINNKGAASGSFVYIYRGACPAGVISTSGKCDFMFKTTSWSGATLGFSNYRCTTGVTCYVTFQTSHGVLQVMDAVTGATLLSQGNIQIFVGAWDNTSTPNNGGVDQITITVAYPVPVGGVTSYAAGTVTSPISIKGGNIVNHPK